MLAIDTKAKQKNRIMNVIEFIQYLYNLDKDNYDVKAVMKELYNRKCVDIYDVKFIITEYELKQLWTQIKPEWKEVD